MIDTPCPVSHRSFVVEAGNHEPSSQHHHFRERGVDQELHTNRTAANRAARRILDRGMWVEVYDGDTRELLAGPFDPDQAAPAYIV